MERQREKSPRRLTSKALRAAREEDKREDQKLISKKEDKPTPSQPRNIRRKLSEVTRRSIKKVNKERKDKKRWR